MKKIYTKISKPQWRVTVPNINTSLFKKVISNNNESEYVDNKRRSGSYDVQKAQEEYDRSRSLPNSVYVNSDSSCSDSSDSERYQDARASDKNSFADLSNRDISDSELYTDIDTEKNQAMEQSNNINNANSQYEYDVPKISFSFFERKNKLQQDIDQLDQPSLIKSEIKIILAPAEENYDDNNDTNKIEILPCVELIKSGSDPNLAALQEVDRDDEDEGFYKVPRKLTHDRLSRSLSDFNIEDFDDNTSIEHISCSQVINQNHQQQPHHEEEIVQNISAQTSENMDYCKVRSKLPLKLRRPTFLRKPRKALDTWTNFKEKFANMMSEHAAQQRVGAFDEKDRTVINLEDVYNSSKSKCKTMLKSTSKIFRKTPENNSVTDSSSQIVKNDAFFAKVPLTPNDIEYKFNYSGDNCDSDANNSKTASPVNEKDFDFSTIKSVFRKGKFAAEGQNGFEDLRRYVKQGGDFSKEVATILQERAEAESQYAKSLQKLSTKLSRACRDGVGGLNEAWKAVAVELEARAEIHRLLGQSILEETAKPLRNIAENQHRTRKQCEAIVDKTSKSLADWRAAEAKGKKQSHVCARENEKLQDAAILDHSRTGKLTLARSTSLIQLAHNINNKNNNSEKENTKLEGKKRKAEDAVKKADIEYYTLCVRAERARLEWESAVLRGVNTFQFLEEERLNNLKSVLNTYLQHEIELGPRLVEAVERLKSPVQEATAEKDLNTFINLRQSTQQVSEQLLPDFYCEHITLAMNRERRKQALIKLLHLIRQDIERERKSKNGLENLSKAIKQTPNFGAEDSQQSVTEKLYHMKSMLTYLEGARYKVHNALAELDSKPKSGHPLAPHITITRDKSGLQQSILKVPQWLREEWFEVEKSPVSEKSLKSDNSDPHNNDIANPIWVDRGAADGNSNQHDSDFDEFSSQCSSGENVCSTEESPVQPIAKCKALYAYTPNLTDELALQPGDLLSVYRKQDDGWWLGECKGNVGIFPATYVEIINSN